MKRYLILILVVFGLTSCQYSLDEQQKNDRLNFTFEVEQYADGQPISKAQAGTDKITQLTVGIYNTNGVLVSDLITTQSPDLTELSIEGLEDGEYTAVFIGVGERRSAQKPLLVLPDRIEETWLPNPEKGAAHNNEYFYTKNQFTIKDNKGVSSKVSLKRVVGRVDIEPVFTDGQWTKGGIKSILVSFEDGSFYTSHKVDNSYSGAGPLNDYEAIDHFNFYTLPTTGTTTKHGSLTITGTQGDGTEYKVFYEFDLIVEANKRAIIRPTYGLNADMFGTIRVYDADRNAKNSKLFFQDPTDGFHHYKAIPEHSFKMNGLLKLTYMNNNKQLKVQFYSLLPVKNVTVYVRRINDVEYFEVAWFESMNALEERIINLSSSPDNRVYRTESGGAIFVDKMNSDLEYKYVSEDPHMKKIATLKWPCHMSFIQPTNDTLYNKAKYMPFRAVYAREAVALWTNLAFLYSHPLWEKKMLEEEAKKPFMHNGLPVSIKDVFIPQIFNKRSNNYLVLNILQHEKWETAGEAYIGSGDMLGMRPNVVYTHHYVQDQDTYQNIYNVGLHEYGHTLGYGHDGDFTYGRCTDVNVACIRAIVLELPYPSSKLLNSTKSPYLYLSR